MSQTITSLRRWSEPSQLVLSVSQVLGFALLTAIAAKVQFYFPFSPVPVTLQTAVVLLAGVLLGPKKAAASQLSLIGMGLAGLPVFTLPLPGYLVLMGPTGGYILGFVLAAWISGALFQKKQNSPAWFQFILLFVASLYIFVPGMLWLGMVTGFEWHKILMAGFAFHLPGDIAKCLLVLGIYRLWKSRSA